jgi:hypothetical protein
MENPIKKRCTLQRLRENKLKREKYEKFRELNYKVPAGISLYTLMIKEQNKIILESISKYKNLSKKETEELFDKFFKVNYYCPNIVSDKKFKDIYRETDK